MATTIKQIAELANVSRGTVDKVIHNRPGVKQETRVRVQEIIKELNFQPNPIGKALATSHTKTQIGVVLSPAYNQFMQITMQGIQHAANALKPYGVEVIMRMPSDINPAEELNILRGMYQDGIKNIALFPLDDPYVIEYANKLAQGGASLITFNSDIQAIHSLWFIGQNHYQGGRTAAQLMEKLLPQGGKIGVIISSNYISCHQDRLSGFEKRLSESNYEFKITNTEANKDITSTAFKITMRYLKECPDLAGIYITGGGVSGVAAALKLMHLETKVKLICHDLLPDSAQLLKENILDFVIDQDPFHQGELIVQTLFEYSSLGKMPSEETCCIPINIQTGESINKSAFSKR